MLNEGNKEDQYLEKKGESSKTTAMRKASSRRGRFSSGDTHQDAERESNSWTRPGTRPHANSLDRQRKGAHRMSRGRKKPQAGSSSEQRKTDAIWQSRFPEDRPKGKYEKLQDKKEKGQPTGIEAQKQGLLRKGEKRRELRTQAVAAIRRAVGGGYVNEAKVDDRLSADQKETIRNRRLSRTERLPVRGETPRDTEERLTQTRRDKTTRQRGAQGVRGTQLPKYKKHAEYGGITFKNDFYPEKVSARRDELRAKRARNNIRSFGEEKTFTEFIIEANRRAQRASKSGKIPKEGPRSKGDDKPKAVVTVGLPGSGKSTIAKHMVSKGKTDQHELDKSRQALGKGPAYFGQDIVKHTYDGAKRSAEQGKSTVLSNTSIPKQHRKDAIDKLKDSGYEDVKAVLAPGSTKAAMRRNRKRTGSKPGEGAVPQFVMNRMAQGMKGMSRAERRELRGNYKELHKSERFTKPAMKRSGAIKEEFKDLTPEKEERVRNRVGELARDIQVSGARMKKLNKKPFGKYRPKVRAEKESILKSARKKHKLVKNASDALTRTSISREAGIVKKMYDLKKRMDDELNG